MAKSDVSAKSSRFLTLASVVLVVAVLYFAQEVLVPIAMAILFSFLLAPLVRRLEKLKVPRVAAVLVSVILALGVFVGVGFIVYNEMADFARNLPAYSSNIQAKVDSIRGGNGFLAGVKKAREEVQHLFTPTTTPSTAPAAKVSDKPVPAAPAASATAPSNETAISPIQLIEDFGAKILSPVGSCFIIVVFTIFMLLEREDMRDRLISLVGRTRLTMTTEAMDDAGSRVSRYLLMQLVINGSVGVAVMIALWIVGKVNGEPFPSPPLWGLLAGLLRFIPYVGIWIAAVMPLVVSLSVFASAKVALETLLVYVGIELIAANVFEPLLFGSSTGIATLAVLIAALFWTWLWGPIGLVLATPMTVCLVVLGKHVPHLGFLTILLGDTPPLEPPDRVYQRLLALDEENAAELVNEYGRKMAAEELYDDVLLPTLAMAERDQRQGNLDEERIGTIYRGLRDIVEEWGERYRAERIKAAAKRSVDIAKGETRTDGAPVNEPVLPEVKVGSRLMVPKGCAITVACLAAHDEADEIAAMMFAQLLEIRGYCTHVVSMAHLTSERVAAVESLHADVVCISSLPPAALSHARYLFKRLQGKLPDLGALVGLWTDTSDLKRAKDRIGETANVRMAANFRSALQVIHQMAETKMVATEPRLPA